MDTAVFVSHHQFQVVAGAESGDYLGLYRVGDDLLQVTGRTQLTVLTGPHTGEVGVRVVIRPEPPDEGIAGWDVGAEATVWCPQGRLAVGGLMSDFPKALRDIPVDRAGLVRVRVQSRHRQPETSPPRPAAVEQYQVTAWPVDVDTGFRSLHAATLSPDGASAAGWAMLRLVGLANPSRQQARLRLHDRSADETTLPRVAVHRRRTLPTAQVPGILDRLAEHLGATSDGTDLVLPAGDLEVRLRPRRVADGIDLAWRWLARSGSSTAVPDPETSTAEIRVRGQPAGLTVTHAGVRAPDAVLLGLIWDHLLDRVEQASAGHPPPVLPWVPLFDDLAAKAAEQAARARRSWVAFEAHRWGGTPPSDRLRDLPANTIGLARLDRPLLDALAQADPQTQRAVARWAAHQACATAGLTTVGWIADALAALDRDDPLPPPFDDEHALWQRLFADERVPATTVTTPDGTPNFSQQAIALPAIRAAAHDDPLAGAVDTVYFAALVAGEDHYRDALAAALARLTGKA
jgi:hypothetical protein